MLPSTAFRFSTYLTQAIAWASLGYAEAAVLPEVGVFTLVVLGAMAVIYRLETRVRLLSIEEANRVGGGIGLAALIWAAFRVVRELNTVEHAAIGWPVFLVALMAPMLMAASCAKLLRREKHAGDYWFMYIAGLAAIILAGAMADHPLVVVLTAAYALCGVWSLYEFFRARSNGTVPNGAANKPGSAGAIRVIRTTGSLTGSAARLGFVGALLWTSLAAAAALPLYLLTPRSPYARLEFGQPRIEIGYAADQMIDLTKTGELRKNPETAFEVAATDKTGRPKEDLSSEQRWRGAILVNYSKGSWARDSQAVFPTAPEITRLPSWAPPDLGPSAYQLRFSVPASLGSQFLADPVMWEPDQPSPIALLLRNRPPQPWHPLSTGQVFGLLSSLRAAGPVLHYVQHTRPPAEPYLSPPYFGTGGYPSTIVINPIPSVKEYADQVLADLVAAGRLPAATLHRDPITLRLVERYHEVVAIAFRDHLSERPDLVYTTDLKRVNKSVDPVEDFLFYSKAGHCERFATALVLMLRAEGIPSVLVLGFKGCEHVGEGHYLVRQEHAHVWAEALIVRRDPARQRGVRHWLGLDPAPVRTDASADGDSGNTLLALSQNAFERYLFHYTPAQREQAIHTITSILTSTELMGGAGAIVLMMAAIGLIRKRARREPPPTLPPEAEWFSRLLPIREPHGIAPRPGETAREFAAAAAAILAADPAGAAVAGVPIECVDAYYRSRFGGAAIADERRVELDLDLEALNRVLGRKNTWRRT
jgi:protein-glutamine gamma-glutamyltransferase